MTVVMKIDLAGPARRGLALGLNEAAGYLGVAVTAFLTGALAATYAPQTVIWVGGVVIVLTGLIVSYLFVQDTGAHVAHEQRDHGQDGRAISLRQALIHGTFRQPVLRACSQAGLVNNLNDALAWGLAPLYLAANGASTREIGIVAAVYPALWGAGQLVTGLALRSHRAEAVDRARHARAVCGSGRPRSGRRLLRARRRGCRSSRCRHRARVPDAHRGGVRCRAAEGSRPVRRGLPLLARCRLRARCAACGCRSRCCERGRSDRRRRGAHGRQWIVRCCDTVAGDDDSGRPRPLVSYLFVRDTGAHVAHEQLDHGQDGKALSLRRALTEGTFAQPVLRACSQAGLVNNLNDALAWGLAPLYLAANGASAREIGIVAGVYPARLGCRPARDGLALRPHRTQAAHRVGHARPGGALGVARRQRRRLRARSRGRGSPWRRHGARLSDAHRRRLRCGATARSRPSRRRLSLLA